MERSDVFLPDSRLGPTEGPGVVFRAFISNSVSNR